MKGLNLIMALTLMSLVACKQEPKKELSTTADDQSELPAKTYAEISVRTGGEWVDHKYVGGGAFVNVESLKLPEEHTDHSFYIRYEGPGWESSKVGYRLYLDWRNAIDIFGKVTDTMVLHKVGQDNFDSYHEMNTWGMDILKAGKSLGIGSIGRDVNDSVVHFNVVDSTKVSVQNTAVNSTVNVNYYGWTTEGAKIDLSSVLSIKPDERITRHEVTPSEAISGICTGIVKFDNIDLIQKTSENGEWGYIATYGEQTLVPDKLGMVVFYKTSEVEKITDSQFDHLIVFKPTTETITWYFAGAWEKEKNGITNREDFISYIDKVLSEL